VTGERRVAAYRLCAALLPGGRVLADLDVTLPEGRERETVADMRSLSFGDDTFACVLSVRSIGHVPEPERVLDEVVRVLEPGGLAVFVVPNDGEYDAGRLRALCERHFERVELRGVFGSPGLRRLFPRRDAGDLRLEGGPLDGALDLVAVCRAPEPAPEEVPAAPWAEAAAPAAGPPFSSRSGLGLGLLLFLGAALIAGFTALRGVDYFDEGLVLQAARRVAMGQVPYRDFLWPYGPAEPYLLGASFKLFGVSLLGWRILRVAVVALTALVVYALARRLAGPRAGLVAWLVAALALAQPANASPFPVALLLGLLAVAVASRSPVRPRDAVLAGLLAGFAAAWRLDFGVYAGVACAAALLLADTPGRVRTTARMAVSALAVTALSYAAFAVLTGPGDLYQDLIGRSLREKGYWTLPFPLRYHGGLLSLGDAKDALGFYLPLIVVIGLAVAAAALVARTLRERRPPRAWVALGVLALAGLAYLLSRTDEFHVTPLLVALAVLLPAVFAWARSLGGRLGGALAAGSAAVLILLGLYGASNRLSALVLPPDMEAIDVAAADGVRAPPAEARSLERVVATVKREVPLGQPIYVAPRRSDLVSFSAPLVYVLAERDNPLREDVGLWASAGAQERIVRTLRREQPRIVVRWTDPLSSKREPNPRGRPSGSRALDEYLARAYSRLERLPDFDVLILR
jgi:SAM-dependent methyltransferase